MPDEQNVCFVIGLNKPLRQGQTIYKYAIITFQVDIEVEIDTNWTLAKMKKLDKSLTNKLVGKYFEVFSNLFKCVSNINIVIPSNFRTFNNENAISCSVGAKQGHLFFMSKSIMFVQKPIIHLRFDQIARVEFHRITSNMSNRGFDLELFTKSGESQLFSGIDKNDSESIMALFRSKKIMVTTAKELNDEGTSDLSADEGNLDEDQ